MNATQRKKVMVVTHDGQPRRAIERDVRTSSIYRDSDFVYVSAYRMPSHPLEGTNEILLDCDPGNYFRDQLGAYSELMATRLIWNRDGRLFTTRSEGLGLKDAI